MSVCLTLISYPPKRVLAAGGSRRDRRAAAARDRLPERIHSRSGTAPNGHANEFRWREGIVGARSPVMNSAVVSSIQQCIVD